jgi:peptidoglycan/LPS O-acetylase OafA/YrhL
MTRLPVHNLDVLRAVAVLSVVGDHVLQLTTKQAGPLTVWELGRLGVLLFFVHTALVLMSSLERQGQTPGWVGAFYLRRAFRIYPLAIVCILGYLAFHIPPSVRSLTHPTTFVALSWSDIAQNLLLVQNLFDTPLPINVLWSLPIEVQMYLALPIWYLLAWRSPMWVVGLIGAAAVVWWAGDTFALPGFWRLTVLNFTPCFLGGVLAYALLRRGARPTLPSWTWPFVLFAVAIGLTALLHPSDETAPMNWLVCLGVGLTIPFVRELPKNRLTRVAKVVCDYSYGIYLTHVAALWIAVVVGHAFPSIAQAIVFVALASLFAFVSYHGIEQPGIAAGKRLAAALTGTRQRPTRPSRTPPRSAIITPTSRRSCRATPCR